MSATVPTKEQYDDDTSDSRSVLLAANEASKQAEMAALLLKQLQNASNNHDDASLASGRGRPPPPSRPPPPPSAPPPPQSSVPMNHSSPRYATSMTEPLAGERVEVVDYSTVSLQDRTEAARRLSRYRRKKRRAKAMRRVTKAVLRIVVILAVSTIMYNYLPVLFQKGNIREDSQPDADDLTNLDDYSEEVDTEMGQENISTSEEQLDLDSQDDIPTTERTEEGNESATHAYNVETETEAETTHSNSDDETMEMHSDDLNDNIHNQAENEEREDSMRMDL